MRIDDLGHAVLWSPFVTFEQIAELATVPIIPRSAFKPTHNMAANLVRTEITPRLTALLGNLCPVPGRTERGAIAALADNWASASSTRYAGRRQPARRRSTSSRPGVAARSALAAAGRRQDLLLLGPPGPAMSWCS
ncbi:MAG: hypothetical protein R2715_08510 [Ilumatobacteraceae bacterium]